MRPEGAESRATRYLREVTMDLFVLLQSCWPVGEARQLIENVQATGTTVKGIAAKRLKRILLPIPPLRVQRRIVAYLDGLQAKADRLKAQQAQSAADLEALLPSVLEKAFGGEL